jgi:23S rRNA (adenine2030-N6)-methyltransferase
VNYRHAYHAGNFADVLKHAVLVGLIESLKQKATPFCVLDTHAGSARYSLTSVEAEKTREFASGIQPLLGLSHLPGLLHIYLNLVRSFNSHGAHALHTYPGSPLIAAALMRECRPAARLRAASRGGARPEARVPRGRTGVLPSPRRLRGAARAAAAEGEARPGADRPAVRGATGGVRPDPGGLIDAHRRWPNGIYAVWYPIKLRQDIEAWYRRLATLPFPRILIAELCLHEPNSALRLNGCGMALINPPYRFDHALGEILPALAKALEQSRFGSHELRWLRHE